MKHYFFIFGFGYVAQFLAPKLSDLGFDIVGTSRNNHKNLEKHSYRIINFLDSDIEAYLSKTTHILLTIPPIDEVTDIVLTQYNHLIKKYRANIKWIGYLSSTGVYGNHDGEWVNELSTCRPLGRTGILRLEAETVWTSLAKAYELPLHIFRLAGIYGPGRNALERIVAGKRKTIYKEDQVFSRIYIDDIVTAILASIHAPRALSIYNLADDEPAPSHAVDNYAAYLLNKQPLLALPFEEAPLSPMAKEFYSNNRRISNCKIKKELNFTLQYPSFRDGLNKIFEDLG